MSQDVVWWATQYANYGWPVVVCHGVTVVDGVATCSCGRGLNCLSPGKHPVGNEWQKKASTDEEHLTDLLMSRELSNIGIQWGPNSGVIDIEFDDEKGRAAAKRWGLEELFTPTFTSARSTHRICRWSSRLPEQAVIKFDGLEVRIGGGDRGSQSIVPPSQHASGVSYTWVNGFTPEDCEPADIPPELLNAIINFANGKGDAPRRPSANAVLHKKVGEGSRHDELVRYAARKCIECSNIDNPVNQQEIFREISMVNRFQFDPPLPEQEVIDIWQHEMAWAKRHKLTKTILADEEKDAMLDDRLENKEEVEEEDKTIFALSGLEFRDGEWFPGRWKLTVLHSDPVTYILHIPVYRHDLGKTRIVEVNLDVEQFMNPYKVAAAVLAKTHTVILDAVPEEWSNIWNGKGSRKGAPAVRGLKAKLMDGHQSQSASAEHCRFATVAGWFLDALSITPKPDDDDDEDHEPDVTGMPAWVRSKDDGRWELWFGWQRVWEMVDRGKRKLDTGEILTCKKMILKLSGDDALITARHRVGEEGLRRRYVKFLGKHLKALEALASGQKKVQSETSFSSSEEIPI